EAERSVRRSQPAGAAHSAPGWTRRANPVGPRHQAHSPADQHAHARSCAAGVRDRDCGAGAGAGGRQCGVESLMSMTGRRAAAPCVAFLLCWLACAGVQAQTAHWVGSWACSQQQPEPQNALSPEDLRDATLREVVHLSIGGDQIRMHISNAFGSEPLHLTAVHVARPGTGRGTIDGSIDASTDRELTFGGKPDVTVPAGAEYISDPIAFPVAAFSDLAVSLHYDQPPAQQTGHPG